MTSLKNDFKIFLVLLLILMSGCAADISQNKKPSPNILLIMTDDQGWGDLHFHGNDSIDTPNLDKLAKRSIQLEHFFVSPVCAPTRASLLTGRYHLRTGTSWVTHRKEVMRSEENTIAEIFKQNNYATGIFGKWHNGSEFPYNPIGQGFDEFYGFAAGHWNNYFNTTLWDNNRKLKSVGYITDALTERAIQFIKKNNAPGNPKPFLCYVPYNAPHSPFQVPDKYFEKYKKRGLTDKNASVYGMVENIDENVGALLQTLEEQQIMENTIVVFLTDNGPNGNRYNGNMKGWKGSVHEGGVRVPCFISWKNHLPENKKITPISAHIDLLPTLAELCDVEIPNDNPLDGKSLVPLFQEENSTWEARNIFTIHTEGQLRPRPAAVRNDRYRLVVNRAGKTELYDMENDEAEQINLATKFPKITSELESDLENWFQEVTEKGISPPSISVGNLKSPMTELPASEAQLLGNIKFKGKMGWANDYIIDWKNKDDQVVWEIENVTEGKYEIVIKYNANEKFLPANFKLKVGETEKDFQIDEAMNFKFLPSPDRVKRREVYEKVWGKKSAGVLHLPIGENKISVILQDEVNDGWLEIKGIEINKLEK